MADDQPKAVDAVVEKEEDAREQEVELPSEKEEDLIEQKKSDVPEELDDIDPQPAIYLSPKWDDLPAKWHSVVGVSVCSDKNRRYRRTMEDAHICIDNFQGIPKDGYFAIYDGHGGRDCVEYVEKHLHENLTRKLKENMKVPQALKESYLETDIQVAENKITYSGATSVSCLIATIEEKRMLYTANCGDARAVLCRNGKAIRLTIDHKANDPDEILRIREAGGFIVMNRVNGILAVTRSLGDHTMKECVTGEPYINEIELTPEDSHLIVACDGVWDVLEDQAACDIVLKEQDLKKKAERLVGHSLKGGSTDNISVIVTVL
mmetsp:Transcript_23614/g.32227  ORF Transcript_23614/g.32227 Transcript_23614/m.32227 type:complete len:320 (+) Transcript_23614:74-1033(+)|eukprot:CAMPEP_0201477780 /NCGR_PEP_ID=MMETSP0151_2-20130828/2740_1 /ASSEMBLY_ACC=CAM_ASM_000257 /TAXON_ID=200890 /ORGANISM="Paramoeba atlantica, Strain 621/1 / CCAP 1560/9" /LENGTH=319 /DNA_ID=CAMNT_0047858613 /DNA_START=48 /DNA_END=1007 /DNA_ORIENTATION=-